MHVHTGPAQEAKHVGMCDTPLVSRSNVEEKGSEFFSEQHVSLRRGARDGTVTHRASARAKVGDTRENMGTGTR